MSLCCTFPSFYCYRQNLLFLTFFYVEGWAAAAHEYYCLHLPKLEWFRLSSVLLLVLVCKETYKRDVKRVLALI